MDLLRRIIMKELTINEIIELWKSDKKLYVKKLTYAAYVLCCY